MELWNLTQAIDAAAPLDAERLEELKQLLPAEREVLAYALSLRSAAVRRVMATLAAGTVMAEYSADMRIEVNGALRTLNATDLSVLKGLLELSK